jgi:3-oxoacyl-(acyl-carrier-protein) synthase
MSGAAERVVVTGIGVVAPNGNGKEAFARALREGRSGIRFLPQLKEAGFGCQVAGVPEGVDEIARVVLSEADLFAMNSGMVYAALAAIEAWKDAGLPLPSEGSDDVDWGSGAIIGTASGGMDTIANRLVPGTAAGRVARLGSTMPEQTMCSGQTARLGGLLALGNRVSTNSSACNSGVEAVVEAFHHVRSGHAVRMLAGGAEGHSHYFWAGFDAMKVLCRTHNEAPAAASRPMSASAGGFVPGAGSGVLLLESHTSAIERGARIYAEVLGGVVNSGGHRGGGSITAPNPDGVRRCVRGAVAMSGIEPDAIDVINGHLTATMGDVREVEGWSAALELPPARMPLLQATKSLVGHALGAAGGIECVATVLELEQGFVHGSINCEDLHPALASYAARIPHVTVERPDLRVIAKASFGFGDVNGCLVFRKFQSS